MRLTLKAPLRLPNPVQCVLWRFPERLDEEGRILDRIKTFHDSSHDHRTLEHCGECGQTYLHDWHEEIDWDDGMDGQYATRIPVFTQAHVDLLSRANTLEMPMVTPRLQIDSNVGDRGRTVRWIADIRPPGGMA